MAFCLPARRKEPMSRECRTTIDPFYCFISFKRTLPSGSISPGSNVENCLICFYDHAAGFDLDIPFQSHYSSVGLVDFCTVRSDDQGRLPSRVRISI
jgi:hypothetical protein